MATLSIDAVRNLLAPHRPPCLSLYMPTHRRVPAKLVDIHLFRRLVDSLEASIASGPAGEVARLLAPFHELDANASFWRHTLDGLAVMASDGNAEIFRVQRPFQPLAIVSQRFHTMPLLRLASSVEWFDVLALTSREARVYEGSADAIDPVEFDGGWPKRGDFIDEEIFQPHRVRQAAGPTGSVHGGFGSKADAIDADTERFFRAVDDLVVDRVSNRTGLPLVLVAISEHASVFRRLSRNGRLLEEGVATDPKMLGAEELLAAVSPLFEAESRRRADRLVAAFRKAADQEKGSGDVADIARAAVAGRVATLLVEEGRMEIGRFDRATGAIAWGESRGAGGVELVGDIFGILAEEVLLHEGSIVSVPRIGMPTESGAAALYRY